MHADTTRPQGKVVAPIGLHCKGDTYCTVPLSALHIIQQKMASNKNIQNQYEFELGLISFNNNNGFCTFVLRSFSFTLFSLPTFCVQFIFCIPGIAAATCTGVLRYSVATLYRICTHNLLKTTLYRSDTLSKLRA